MDLGAYSDPRHWPEDQWGRDIERIAALGFHFIHCADSAWARLEPEDGRFDFAWLEIVVNPADKNGLKVVMCTPSARIPAWQIGNEPHIQCGEDYSPSGQAAFIQWLRGKYETIAAVNGAPGASFW